MSDIEQAARKYTETRRDSHDQYADMVQEAFLAGASAEREACARMFDDGSLSGKEFKNEYDECALTRRVCDILAYNILKRGEYPRAISPEEKGTE
jgi:hypothetical protein